MFEAGLQQNDISPMGRRAFKQKIVLQPGEKLQEKSKAAVDDSDSEAGVLCANCRTGITSLRHVIEKNGRHQHNFINPDGIFYCLGCFAEAPGCRNIGRSCLDHTWFSGFGWRISLCGKCRDHLGWFYQSAAGGSFFGLILDKLIFADQ